MPKYDYVALDQKGNETKGHIEHPNEVARLVLEFLR